jgi:putative DeoR family transcriptional regulator (stage III sporulation protein D)
MARGSSAQIQDYIEQRISEEAHYIIDHKATVRNTAKIFTVSKSCIFHDMRDKLPKMNPGLANEVKDIMEFNKSQRHIRGGETTKLRYKGVIKN